MRCPDLRLFVGLGVLVACQRASPALPAPGPVQVSAAQVTRGDVTSSLVVRGFLQALPGRDVKLGTLLSGRLAGLPVAEGDVVAAGALLARIEPTVFRDVRSQAEAGLAQTRAQTLNADLRLTRARLAFDAGVAAAQEVDDAQAQAAAARSAQRAAEATLSTAQNQLGRTELRAPFAGSVAHVFAAVGEPVDGTGKPLIEITDASSLELHASVDQASAARLSVGAAAVVDGEVGPPVTGAVVAVSPTVDPVSGTVLVRVRFDNAEGRFKVGAVAGATFPLAVAKGVLRVPTQALVPRVQEGAGDGKALAVEKIDPDGRVVRVGVEAGVIGGTFAEVRSGVILGDTVVTSGGYALPDGTAVSVAGAGDAGAAAGAGSP